jgi:hypothetical protein
LVANPTIWQGISPRFQPEINTFRGTWTFL